MANPEPLERDDDLQEEESPQASNVITFDRGKSLHQQFAQYLDDPDVVAAASTVFGKKTRERMAQLEYELAEARRQNETAGLGEMRSAIEKAREDPEERQRLLDRVAADPDFNKKYWAAMNGQPQQGGYSKDAIEARQAINNAYEDLLMAGAPQQWVQQAVNAYEGAIQQGQLGNTPTAIAVQVQRRIGDVIRNRAWEPKEQPKQPEPEEEVEEVQPNPNIGRSQKQRMTIGPGENPRLAERADASPSRGGGGSPRKSSRPQYATRQQAARLFAEGQISADEYRRAKQLPYE